jgi:hypothetical protein
MAEAMAALLFKSKFKKTVIPVYKSVKTVNKAVKKADIQKPKIEPQTIGPEITTPPPVIDKVKSIDSPQPIIKPQVGNDSLDKLQNSGKNIGTQALEAVKKAPLKTAVVGGLLYNSKGIVKNYGTIKIVGGVAVFLAFSAFLYKQVK